MGKKKRNEFELFIAEKCIEEVKNFLLYPIASKLGIFEFVSSYITFPITTSHISPISPAVSLSTFGRDAKSRIYSDSVMSGHNSKNGDSPIYNITIPLVTIHLLEIFEKEYEMPFYLGHNYYSTFDFCAFIVFKIIGMLDLVSYKFKKILPDDYQIYFSQYTPYDYNKAISEWDNDIGTKIAILSEKIQYRLFSRFYTLNCPECVERRDLEWNLETSEHYSLKFQSLVYEMLSDLNAILLPLFCDISENGIICHSIASIENRFKNYAYNSKVIHYDSIPITMEDSANFDDLINPASHRANSYINTTLAFGTQHTLSEVIGSHYNVILFNFNDIMKQLLYVLDDDLSKQMQNEDTDIDFSVIIMTAIIFNILHLSHEFRHLCQWINADIIADQMPVDFNCVNLGPATQSLVDTIKSYYINEISMTSNLYSDEITKNNEYDAINYAYTILLQILTGDVSFLAKSYRTHDAIPRYRVDRSTLFALTAKYTAMLDNMVSSDDIITVASTEASNRNDLRNLARLISLKLKENETEKGIDLANC